jgi:hypothetical protein
VEEVQSMAEQTKRQQLELHLAARALQDPDFREKLLEAPKQTIEKEIGLHFPLTLEIKIHEERLNQLHVVLPMPFSQAAATLHLRQTGRSFSKKSRLLTFAFWSFRWRETCGNQVKEGNCSLMSVRIASPSKRYLLKLINLCASYPRPRVAAYISQRTRGNWFVHTLILHSSLDTNILSNSHRPHLMGECTHSMLRRSTPGIASNTFRLISSFPQPHIRYSKECSWTGEH